MKRTNTEPTPEGLWFQVVAIMRDDQTSDTSKLIKVHELVQRFHLDKILEAEVGR